MSNQFQNRLVGTIVVVALGVIFLPDMLDGKSERQQENFSEIPLRPTFNGELKTASELQTGDQPMVETEAEKEPEAPKSKDSANLVADISTPPAIKAAVTQKDEVAFTIQLGSFNNAENVNALVKKLRKAGLTAYTLPNKPINNRMTKVFVGPNISKSKLQQMQTKIVKLTKLKGKIIAYDPLKRN
ncbi:MAG: SPOR domain-containing protein [Parashewanella sp.]